MKIRPVSSMAVAAALLLLVCSVVAAVVSFTGGTKAGPSTTLPAVNAAQNELHLELNSNGFNPSTAQRSAGTFDITVENSVMSGEYTLRLKNGDGTVLKELSIQKGSAAWTVTLEVGQYTLTEANNPQWVCQITVQ
jgi:hypothetical protein